MALCFRCVLPDCLMKPYVHFSAHRAGDIHSGGSYFSLWCLPKTKHVLNMQMEYRGFVQDLGHLGANS